MREITLQSEEEKQVLDITDRINGVIGEIDISSGHCHLFILHTTAALTTADLDPGTDLDMLDAFYGMIPDLDYRHPHNPDHVPDHVLATLIGPHLTVPVEAGEAVLGSWQRIVLFEFNGPRERHMRVWVQSET